MNEIYKVFTDAGSRGNPGKAAASAILLNSKDMLVDLNGQYLGIMTNNMAEYEGLIIGLKLAIKHKCNRVSVFMDSQLVVRQIKGEYKVKDEKMKMKYNVVKELMRNFEEITFEHILRNKNSYADKLVNIILDAQ